MYLPKMYVSAHDVSVHDEFVHGEFVHDGDGGRKRTGAADSCEPGGGRDHRAPGGGGAD